MPPSVDVKGTGIIYSRGTCRRSYFLSLDLFVIGTCGRNLLSPLHLKIRTDLFYEMLWVFSLK